MDDDGSCVVAKKMVLGVDGARAERNARAGVETLSEEDGATIQFRVVKKPSSSSLSSLSSSFEKNNTFDDGKDDEEEEERRRKEEGRRDGRVGGENQRRQRKRADGSRRIQEEEEIADRDRGKTNSSRDLCETIEDDKDGSTATVVAKAVESSTERETKPRRTKPGRSVRRERICSWRRKTKN